MSVVLLGISLSAFGGRMLDPVVPVARPAPSDSEPAQATDAEMEEDTEPAEGSVRDAEPADEADADNDAEPVPAAPPKRWQWSQKFTLGVSYDDNIFISAPHKEADAIFKLSADFGLLWGDYLNKEENFLSIQYAPSVSLFAEHREQNAFEQDAALAGQWRLTKLTLGAQARVQSLSGGDVDVGERAERNLYRIALTSKYDYSDKTSFEINLSQNTADYRTHLDSVEWVNRNWLDYQLWPKTRVGVGMTLGYLEPEGGDSQTYEQFLARVALPATGKLSFMAEGGVEIRQSVGAEGKRTTPVFRGGVSYRPFDGTEVSVEASRRNYSSASLAGQNYTATGVTATVRQRFFQRFFLTLAAGYEDAEYQATDAKVSPSRHDQYLFVRPGISVAVTKRSSLELYYQYRRNESTAASSSFENNVTGIQASISF